MKQIEHGIWKWTAGEPEAITPVKLFDKSIKTKALRNIPCENKPPVKEGEIKLRLLNRGMVIEMPLEEGEQIYGFGLQLHRVNHTGRKKVIRVNSDPIADTGDSHAPVPFYVSSKGYGVLIDTSRYVTFYAGTNLEKGASAHKKNEKKTVGTTEIELYGYGAAQGDRTMMIDVPHVKGVDVYFFEGPDIKQAVQRYNLFSGGGCLPPMWGLGVWYRAYSAATKEDVIRLAEGFREDNMPVDVFGFEPGWQTRAYSCSFQWDSHRFPAHEAMLKELNEMDYKVNLWEHLFVHPSSPMYEELLDHSGDYEVWEGLVPDLSIEEAKSVFAGHHLKEFVEKGISGFKLDECDSSDYVHSNWSFPDMAQFPSGMDGEQMHNQLGTLYQSAIEEPFLQAGKRTYSQVRASGALAASYPFVLYSDLYDHEVFIRGVVNCGFSGLLWSPEVRQAESAEDLIRRIQAVVLSPMALLNCWRIPNPPWMQVNREKNISGEFFQNASDIREQCKKLFELRQSLIPYLYTCFASYHFEGIPPFRALVMDYPDDEKTYFIEDQYMMGESIMAAPLITGTESRDVYLPKGRWWNFFTNELYEGGQTIHIRPSLDEIPVFVKDNTLIPLAEPVQSVNEKTVFDITIKAYGEHPADTVLFEDDGTSYGYVQGVYNWLSVSWKQQYVTKQGTFSGERYRIQRWETIR